MSVKGVIFDLDGTLAETHGMAIDLIGKAIVAGGGPRLGSEEIMAHFGRNEQGIFQEAVGPGWEQAWDFYVGAYVERHQECAEPFPGIVEMLASLETAGCALGLITAKTALTGRLSLEVLGVERYFPDVRGGAADGVVKRQDIADLLDKWSIAGTETVYVGDSVSDIEEARAAGVIAAAACWSTFADRRALVAAGPDLTFDTVSELAAWTKDVVSRDGVDHR